MEKFIPFDAELVSLNYNRAMLGEYLRLSDGTPVKLIAMDRTSVLVENEGGEQFKFGINGTLQRYPDSGLALEIRLKKVTKWVSIALGNDGRPYVNSQMADTASLALRLSDDPSLHDVDVAPITFYM